MRKLLLGLAAVSALAASAPAAAQYSRNYWNSTRDWDLSRERRLGVLERRLDIDVREGLVSRSELPRLRDLLWRARQSKARYARSGYSSWERGDVDHAIERLQTEMRMAELYENGRRVDDRRGYPGPAYGSNNRGGYDSNNSWADVDDDWDRDDPTERDDDDRDDRFYGRSGQRGADQSAGRSGDAWADSGRSWNNPGVGGSPGVEWNRGRRLGDSASQAPLDLRVGDPAPVNLDEVPQQYRSRFPDGNGVYYRYDHGRIFQVDARTDTIRWVGSVE
jgi:hypothetical protein